MKKKLAMILMIALPGTAALANENGFGVQGGVDWAYGSLGDGATIQNRSMDTLSLRVFPNYDLASAMSSLPVPLKLGPIFSYGFTGQISDPASYSGQNLRGHGYRLGVGIGTDVGKWGFTGGLNFLGSYSLSNKTTSGSDVSYNGYLGGVLSVSYQVLPWLAPSLIAEYGGYGKKSVGSGSAADLGTKLTGWQVGAGVTMRYPFEKNPKQGGETK